MSAFVVRSFLDLSDSPELIEIREKASAWADAFWFPFNISLQPFLKDISLFIPPHLRCVPPESTTLSAGNITRALVSGALDEHIKEIEDTLREAPEGALTLILGIEHALCLAGIRCALKKYPPEKLLVLLLDAHLDLFRVDERMKAGGYEPPNLPDEKISSGNFLITLLEELPAPSEIIVAGVREPVLQSPVLSRILRRRASDRIKIIDASAMENEPEKALKVLKEALAGKVLYLSIDADVASSEVTGAVRFNEVQGIPSEILFKVGKMIGDLAQEGNLKIAGADLTEIFPPFAELDEDRTISFWVEFLNSAFPGVEFSCKSKPDSFQKRGDTLK